MSLGGAIIEFLAVIVATAVNLFARKLGFSEVEAEEIENKILLGIFGFVVFGLIFITFKYS